MGRPTKRKLTLRKRHFFVIEKYVEDEKSVLDLLESIMNAPGLVKEESDRIAYKMNQCRPEITEVRVSTLWRSGKSTHSCRRPTQPSCPISCKPITASQAPINPRKTNLSSRDQVGWLPWILDFGLGEAVLAADVITA